jgi:hypothetical protein
MESANDFLQGLGASKLFSGKAKGDNDAESPSHLRVALRHCAFAAVVSFEDIKSCCAIISLL